MAAADFADDHFDVFLAHDGQDRPVVEAVAAGLRERGLSPWLAEEQVPPGRWFQDVVQRAMGRVKSAAIFIGPAGVGGWHAAELRVFVSRCVEHELPVIPVLLPGVREVPQGLHFLKELRGVRLASVHDDASLDDLVWGITGRHPRRTAAAGSPPATRAAAPAAAPVAPRDDRPTASSLRELLGAVLVADSDLEAFCSDHFGAEVKSRFSNGMDRVAKVTLLLERIDPAEILRRLREGHPHSVSSNQHLLHFP